MKKHTVLLGLALLLPGPLSAQEEKPQDPQERIDDLERRLEELEERYVEDVTDLNDQIEDLEEREGALAGGSGGWNSLTNALTLFNPQVTVIGNILGRLDDQDAFNDDGDAVDNTILLREVELDFRAAIDPYADGLLILAFTEEAPNETGTEVEEGYVRIKSLPFLPQPPLGLKLKGGKFRTDFGHLNRVHLHGLPQITYPRSLQNVLGAEGFRGEGFETEFFLPTPGDSNTLLASAAIVNGGEIAVAEANDANDPAFNGRVHWSWDRSTEHELDIGSSYYYGKADADGSHAAQLVGVDVLYGWRPQLRGGQRSFLVGGEFFYADVQSSGSSTTPIGYYAWAQAQMTQNLFVSARFDYFDELGNDSVQTRTPGVFATYYTSEFLRFRLGYERVFSDDPVLDDLDTVFFEINFVFGSHPAEPFWVNR